MDEQQQEVEQPPVKKGLWFWSNKKNFKLKEVESVPSGRAGDYGDRGFILVRVQWIIPWPKWKRRLRPILDCSFRISEREITFADAMTKVFHDWGVEVPANIRPRLNRAEAVYQTARELLAEERQTDLATIYRRIHEREQGTDQPEDTRY